MTAANRGFNSHRQCCRSTEVVFDRAIFLGHGVGANTNGWYAVLPNGHRDGTYYATKPEAAARAGYLAALPDEALAANKACR